MTEKAVLDVRTLLEPTDDNGAVVENKGRSNRKDAKASKKDALKNWGFPGHLTKEEGDVYVQFRTEIATRDKEFHNTVYSFTTEEGEAHCLTRWLRARKYNLSDTLLMVTQATECRSAPRAMNYYPNPHEALGVDPAVYLSQYPQLYSGFSKDGCPVFYSKPGRLNIDGMECTITLKGMLDYHWHVMQHDYQKRLLGFKRDNPEFRRFECVSILDLSQLTLSQLGSRTLDIIKKQSYIDSLCFPETMNKTIIVNAPKFFTATWGLIKGWLDARTVSKIEMFSSIRAAKGCLHELIDADQIPEDYGGTGENTVVTLEKNGQGTGGMSRMLTECMYVRSYQQKIWIIAENEELDLHVYTRAVKGATFTVTELPSRKALIEETTVIHTGGADGGDPLDKTLPPTTVHLTGEGGRIRGPMKMRVKGQSKGGVFGTEVFLVVGTVFTV